MKKVLVTGGAGFIGSHLVDQLIKEGHQVLVLDDLSCGRQENVNQQAEFIKLDITDKKLAKIMADWQPEIVYHLAAQKNVRTSLENPQKDAQINILGSLNLLEQAKEQRVKKIIFLSTAGVYGEADILPTPENAVIKPMSPYTLTKLAFEYYLQILAQDKIRWTVLRLSNVYGPRQDVSGEAGVIAIFLDNALQGLPLKVNGDGEQTRDYVYVQDVVKALIKVLDKADGKIYNISTQSKISLNELIDNIKKINPKDFVIENRPAIVGEVRHSSLDSSQAKKDLAWAPEYDLAQGLVLTYQWFKDSAKGGNNSE